MELRSPITKLLARDWKARPPREVADGLDAHLHVREQIAHVLVVDDGVAPARGVVLRPLERELEGAAHDADGGGGIVGKQGALQAAKAMRESLL